MSSTTLKGEEAVQAAIKILTKYFVRHKRPYSGTQLYENTKKPVPKTLFQQALSDMVSAGRLSTKTMGKIVIYFPVQPKNDPLSTEEMLDILENELPKIECQYAQISRQATKLEVANKMLATEPTNQELDEAIDASKKNQFQIDAARIAVLTKYIFVQPETLHAAKLEHDLHLFRWLKLRSVTQEVIALCEERFLGEDKTDIMDIAHLSGIFDDNEAAVPNKQPSRLLPPSTILNQK